MKRIALFAVLLSMIVLGACAKKAAPVTTAPPPETAAPAPEPPPPAPQRVDENLPVPAQPLAEDGIAGRSLEDLNRDSPLKPVFFPLDGFDLDGDGRAVVSANAAILKQYPTWMVTIEGHCDERGTAEYNLALGERRAIAVQAYLVSLGIPADRIRTVSYGKEFPFDPGHDDAAWSKNRRAHFVITAK
jgi:peptidoglycan-associated lipoprotein